MPVDRYKNGFAVKIGQGRRFRQKKLWKLRKFILEFGNKCVIINVCDQSTWKGC